MSPEQINPYAGDTRQKADQVRDMFDNIAPAYDFMNRAMTFGIDKRWRRRAVRLIIKQFSPPPPDLRILDLATGTGDLAMLIARRIPVAKVTGLDLSEGMLAVGRKKIADAGLSGRISLQAGDGLNLPFPDDSFDCITIAYGVRNFQDIARGYAEMFRVMRPGGMLCVIELSTPQSPIIRPLYNLYATRIIPLAGRIVSRDVSAYSYLPESIRAVPCGETMTRIISDAGFADAAYRPLTFGVCTIYTALKPL